MFFLLSSFIPTNWTLNYLKKAYFYRTEIVNKTYQSTYIRGERRGNYPIFKTFCSPLTYMHFLMPFSFYDFSNIYFQYFLYWSSVPLLKLSFQIYWKPEKNWLLNNIENNNSAKRSRKKFIH